MERGEGNSATFLVKAEKPSFKVGSSAKLRINLNKKRPAASEQDKENAKKTWTLSANDILDDDLVSLYCKCIFFCLFINFFY